MNQLGHLGGPSMLGQSDVLAMQAKLFKKIFNVVKGVEKIEKSGYNKHQNYHYSTESDLINSVRQLLLDNNLLVLTDSETKEVIKLPKGDGKGENLVTVVNTRHTFCDTETGLTYNIQSTGTGFDNTDKGSFKAITGAMKYFISKNFMVPTEDDPENDGVTVKNAQATIPVKGFSRTKTETLKVTGGTNVDTKVELVEVSKVANDTSHVAEKFAVAAPKAAPSKPSFGRKVTVSKTEPNFP